MSTSRQVYKPDGPPPDQTDAPSFCIPTSPTAQKSPPRLGVTPWRNRGTSAARLTLAGDQRRSHVHVQAFSFSELPF